MAICSTTNMIVHAGTYIFPTGLICTLLGLTSELTQFCACNGATKLYALIVLEQNDGFIQSQGNIQILHGGTTGTLAEIV